MADAIAFVLRKNGFPAGQTELMPLAEVLIHAPSRRSAGRAAGSVCAKGILEPRYFALPGPRAFDVSADGQRFLMIKNAAPAGDEKASPPTLVVVEHWFEELTARLPR